MNEYTAIPYRTPACDKHLPDNASDECPWCKIGELKSYKKACDKITNAMQEWEWQHCTSAQDFIDQVNLTLVKVEELQAKVEELGDKLALLDKNHYEHMQPYMICVPKEVWRKALLSLQEDKTDE